MTAEQVKALFRQRGITFTRWAEENGYNRGLNILSLCKRLSHIAKEVCR